MQLTLVWGKLKPKKQREYDWARSNVKSQRLQQFLRSRSWIRAPLWISNQNAWRWLFIIYCGARFYLAWVFTGVVLRLCERTHTHAENVYPIYISTWESAERARESKRERESEVLNAKQTHSHGRYFPSGCQISRRPRLWLCVMMALKLSHLFILNVWPAINEAQSEEKKSRATIYHTPPRPRRKHAHIQTRRALEMRCACISLNFLWQVTSSLRCCLRRQFYSKFPSCSPKLVFIRSVANEPNHAS